ncbi:MAG: DNA sulfur modification protein DndD [Fimbriimonadaceae bacterium]|nr:DNA sulfur modification protein DndD [Fimbriimonadaceae bacterium]
MLLRTLTLRDWKAFETARFDFPAPTGNRNIVLIGGRNGYGKTTLFEAIALGLFGREGLGLVGRAAVAADEERRNLSYRDFMQRALNARARQQGRLSCHIGLTFQDDTGAPVVLDRTWYFSETGQLKIGENGEQVRIRVGEGHVPKGPPAGEIDAAAWYRDFISGMFLPSHLANFFLFDGEQASVYAERDMARQVSDGIEGLLGLSWVRKLAEALRDYAKVRLNQLPRDATSDSIERLQREITDDEAAIQQAQTRLAALESEQQDATREYDALSRELMGYAGGGSQEEKQELVDQRTAERAAYQKAEDQLFEIVEKELPFALAGERLRRQVETRLAAEAEHAEWEAARQQAEPRVAGAVARVEQRLDGLAPPLSSGHRRAVALAVSEELSHLWHPPPDNAATEIRHLHLRAGEREQVSARLAEAARVGAARLGELLDAKARSAAAAQRLDAEIEARSLTTPQLEEKRKRLNAVRDHMGRIERERGEKQALIIARKPQLDDRRRTLARLTAQLDQSQRPARQARRAEEVAGMLDDLAGEAWPTQIDVVAREMSAAIQAMAHRKDYLNRVQIDPEGAVRLLNRDGRDLREFDLSAGEKQIFTQALFAAVAKVSGMEFPLVVDTPLGRLDEEHRTNVLRHLAERKGQVFLLSTDTEVVGPYLAALEPRLLKTYRLENRRDGDLALSWPVEGYFDRGDGRP